MIDILCNEGCLLNKTGSPSLRILSTEHPTCRSALPFMVAISNRVPSFLIIYLILGSWFAHISRSFLKLNRLTCSTTVNFSAISFGIPTSRISNIASPETTVLDVKLHLFPIRVPLSRPVFPLRRSEIHFCTPLCFVDILV